MADYETILNELSRSKKPFTRWLTTTDDTPAPLFMIAPETGTAGLLEVRVTAFDGADSVAAIKAVSYKVLFGVITLGTPADLIPFEAANGEAVSIAVNDEMIEVNVTGVAAKEIAWVGEYKIIYAFKQEVAP